MIAKVLISKSPQQLEEQINKLLLDLGLKRNHPDILYLEKDVKLGIDQAKKIKNHLSTKPLEAKGKVVIVEGGENFTTEAQNALLKTLEELPENTSFLIGARGQSNFLPTVLSRCQIEFLKINQTQKEQRLKAEVEKILTSTLVEQFAFIEQTKERDLILLCLTEIFHEKLAKNPQEKKVILFLKHLQEAEKWKESNVNIRAVLEYLFLVLPT
ncbi:hypothetical protein HYW42_04350 [Candidatus Daviesbacteria bacterium]|nr:hypothetical protein [Candidatus Daviesbacteria bacterium]